MRGFCAKRPATELSPRSTAATAEQGPELVGVDTRRPRSDVAREAEPVCEYGEPREELAVTVSGRCRFAASRPYIQRRVEFDLGPPTN